MSQGHYGLGIMIIEGKHAEVGQGIFISDIQEGSAAEQVIISYISCSMIKNWTTSEPLSLLMKTLKIKDSDFF